MNRFLKHILYMQNPPAIHTVRPHKCVREGNKRGRAGTQLRNLFECIVFMLVAVGFTGQKGMWPNERCFDPSTRLRVLLQELCMAQGIFYKVVRNPHGSLHEIIKM